MGLAKAMSWLALLAILATACQDRIAQAGALSPARSQIDQSAINPSEGSGLVETAQQSRAQGKPGMEGSPSPEIKPSSAQDSTETVVSVFGDSPEALQSKDCPVTLPSNPAFVPPGPHADGAPWQDTFWYGTPELWTLLPVEGRWANLPFYDGHYTQKVFWWRDGYSWTEEPQPQLRISGRRLDAPAAPMEVSEATNAFNASDIKSAMLVGVDIPTPGCWEITGEYREATLSFVIWVAP